MKKPKLQKLKNGLRVLLIPQHDQQTATVLVLVETGSKYEDKMTNGIAHFLEHMCFKGTSKRPSAQIISSELDALGAEYNAFTGHEYTGYYAKVAHKHVHKALDIVSDLYINPTLDAADIEREKGVIMGEIDMRNDMLPSKTAEIFMSLLYGDQPAGWPIAGPKELIPTFTRDQFVQYRKDHYLTSSTVVVVAGKFDERKLMQDINKQFAGMPTGKKKGKKKTLDTQKEIGVRVVTRQVDQTHLVIGVRGVKARHTDIPALNVMGALLGGGMSSRLFQTMREERGLGYYTHASHDAFTDHGVFAVSAGVDSTRVAEAVEVICQEFIKLMTTLATDAELRKVKDMITGRMLIGIESSDDIAEFFGFQEIQRKELLTPEEIIRKIESVRSRDIRRVANKYLKTERLNLALIGPGADQTLLRPKLRTA